MRTLSMMLMACLVLVLAIATPSLANRPIPNERALYYEDDGPEYGIDPRMFNPELVIASLPIFQPYRPCIPIPVNPEPVIDDGQFHLLVQPVTQTSKKLAH